MSGLYAEAQLQAVKKLDVQREAHKIGDNAEWEGKVTDRRIKKEFERKFEEFTRALQIKLSDERTKRSVCSAPKSVLIPKEGDTKSDGD
jgi:hypothetical protein